MQQICGFWDSSQCPRCKQDNETTTHILICPDNAADLKWRCRVTNLGIWLLEVDTHPAIKNALWKAFPQGQLRLCSVPTLHRSALQQQWSKTRLAGRILWKARSQSLGVIFNGNTTKNNFRFDRVINGLPAWSPNSSSLLTECGYIETIYCMQSMHKDFHYNKQQNWKHLST
jgi:hypothetical protein